jgi:hypothetical protein
LEITVPLDPAWCTTCQSVIPASAITHWTPDGQQHTVIEMPEQERR